MGSGAARDRLVRSARECGPKPQHLEAGHRRICHAEMTDLIPIQVPVASIDNMYQTAEVRHLQTRVHVLLRVHARKGVQTVVGVGVGARVRTLMRVENQIRAKMRCISSRRQPMSW